jgi:hypothetical protein
LTPAARVQDAGALIDAMAQNLSANEVHPPLITIDQY